MTDFKKIDDFTIEKTEVVSETKTNAYDINFLIKQKQDIKKQRDEFVIARNIEIAEVDNLIAEAKKLGIEPSKEASSEASNIL